MNQQQAPHSPQQHADIVSLEDAFIARYINMPVTVFLTNGVQLKGAITTNSPHSLFLARDGITQLVMKQAIATIMPQGE